MFLSKKKREKINNRFHEIEEKLNFICKKLGYEDNERKDDDFDFWHRPFLLPFSFYCTKELKKWDALIEFLGVDYKVKEKSKTEKFVKIKKK